VITYTVTLTGGTSETDTEIVLDLGGSATLLSDYAVNGLTATGTAGRFSLLIPAGQTSVSFTVDPQGDVVFEGAETVIASIVSAKTYASVDLSVTQGSALATIHDDGTDPDGPGGATPFETDRPDAVDDDFTLSFEGSVAANLIRRNDGPAPTTQLSIISVSYTDALGRLVNKAFADLDPAPAGSLFDRQAALADGTLFLRASGESLYEHAGRRFEVTATSTQGTLEYNPSGQHGSWQVISLGQSLIITLDEIEAGQLRYTPLASGTEVGAAEAVVARVVELDWRTDGFHYTIADAGGLAPDTARVSYTITGNAGNDFFQDPIDLGADADVDGITTEVESVLANRARGLAGVKPQTYTLDVANLVGTGNSGESVAKIGAAYDGDLNIDLPESIGDGFQNGVTTFSWINNTFFSAANADPFTSDTRAIVALVAEDTPNSKGVPDPHIQLEGVRVPALTQEQYDKLSALVKFTPNWSPMGFSATLRTDAPVATVIDHDPDRPGQQWRFTVDVSRTGETTDTFMAFYKWIDQDTLDAYAAAGLPLIDLQGKVVSQVGWVDFTKVDPNGDGVSIGLSESDNVLFLDYTITDNALGDNDTRVGRISDPGIPVFTIRTIEVTGRTDIAEGTNAIFDVKLNVPKSGSTRIALSLDDVPAEDGTDSPNGQPLDYIPTPQAYYFDEQGQRRDLIVTDGSVELPARVTSFFVSVPTVEDAESEGLERFTLTATLPEGTQDRAESGIVDDGSGQTYDPTGTPDPNAIATDDRPVTVSSTEVNEASPFTYFDLKGGDAQRISLVLEPGTASDQGIDFGTTDSSRLAFSIDGGTTWTNYTGGLVQLSQDGTMLVRTAITNDGLPDDGETLNLRVLTTGGREVVGTATIRDDGSGPVFDSRGRDTDLPKDDDRPRPPVVLPPPAPPPLPVAPPPAVITVVVPPPRPTFNSALGVESAVTSTTQAIIPDARPAAAVGEVLTSSSGFRATVIEAPQPALVLFRGITDQFVEGNRSTTFNLPADAFAHTRADAVLSVDAKQTDGQPLPSWMQFDSQAGTFRVNPPPGFSGTLEIQITARDTEGRAVSANFKFSVGETAPSPAPATQPSSEAPRPQSRTGLSDQIRLTQARGTLLTGLMRPTWVIEDESWDEILAQSPSDEAHSDKANDEPGLLERLRAARAAQAQERGRS
jgi:hypothetical protein